MGWFMARAQWTKWVVSTIALLASSMLAVWMMMVPHPAVPTALVDRDHLKVWLENIVSAQAATAISIAVIQDGEVVWEMASGTANPFRAQKATPQTRYHIWSVTKLATALTILKLAEDQELDLDLPVAEILPWLDLEGYSNLGYMLLGAIIEAQTGQAYEEAVFERVLEPAGMASSGFVFGEPQTANEALGSHPLVHFFTPFLLYFSDLKDLVRERDGWIWWLNRVYIKATPPTGLIVSARDAARLGVVTMIKGPVLQSDDTVRLMITPDPENFSLGWFERDAAAQWSQHRGGGPGFAAVVRVYPAQGLSIAVLASGTDAPVVDIADVVARSFDGK